MEILSGLPEGGSDSSFFVGGMRPFMYMGEGGEGGNRQILDVVRVVHSGLCMVGESVKVLKLSLIRFNC